MTKRPVVVIAGVAVQTGLAALLIFAVLLFAFLNYSIRNSAESSGGLKLALIVILPLAAAAAATSWGMWKQRAWGWWTALGLNVLAMLSMVPDLINSDARPDWEDLAGMAIFAVALALLFPVQVRHYFLRRSTTGRTS